MNESTSAYEAFLQSKARKAVESGIASGDLHPSLFDFQAVSVRWAVRRGRAALFCDTGLGKTRMQIEWLRQMVDGGIGLIIAPLGVMDQTIEEAAAIDVQILMAEQTPTDPGLYITNYEKLHRFDPAIISAVVLDESSILKSVDGKTRTKLLRDWAPVIPYRLCCTATPAPNDIAELANHAEFLGIMTRPEMLATWFVHDDQEWRLKGHAVEKFYEWLATWCIYVRRPSDLGFSDDGFALPPLEITNQPVAVDLQPEDGILFPTLTGGIQGRNLARRQSLGARVEKAAEIIRASKGQWLVWCGLNAEQDALARTLNSECASIDGSTPEDERLRLTQAWRRGEVRTLVSKLAIYGFGMNFQNCHQMMFLGLGDSWEQYYQGIRREWRFGQKHSVEVVIVTSEAEQGVVENVWRKEREAQRTAEEVVKHMGDLERAEVLGQEHQSDTYREDERHGPDWHAMLGDSVKRLAELADGSVGLSVHSPPFASLYTYSASDRDLGNSTDYGQFFEHYRFIARELLRVTMPCRRACVHVQDVSTRKSVEGEIGLRDFPGDVIRCWEAEGWVYDGKVTVDKDPQAQAIRTKSKALMFVQKNKDSAWSRPAMADYLILFRKPGDNPERIRTDVTNEEWILWARPVWYGVRESDTLQYQSARSEKDEKHIAPLQLEFIERCVRLYSNKGELVIDPFMGIGSTGYVAVRHDRRFWGCELKEEYWNQAVRNLESARAQLTLQIDPP